MVDSSDPKIPSIPDWQKSYAVSSSKPTDEVQSNSIPSTSTKHAELLDEAKHLLDEPSTQGAPREQKVALLEKKGLQADDIQKLLEQEPEMKIIHDSNTSSPSTSTASSSSQFSNEPKSSTISSTTSRDIPPIITYPEFLLRPTKAPPLITVERLVNATYAIAGLSALTYGASKYLVRPMIESLNTARHDFAEATLHSLEKLNAKLEENVSHIPYIDHPTNDPNKRIGDKPDSDVESIDSDPTELFHRDIATQTSPRISRASSFDSLDSLASSDAKYASVLDRQITLLGKIELSLSSVRNSSNAPSRQAKTAAFKSEVDSMSRYLDDLQISGGSHLLPHTSTYDELSASYELSQSDKATASSSRTGKDKKTASEKKNEDETEKFKAEIRAVKGALLSSRTFPAGRPVSVSMGMAGGAGR